MLSGTTEAEDVVVDSRARTKQDRGGGDGGGDDLNLDPLLIALLKKIPSPDKGWPAPSRVRWFRTFAMIVSRIYDGESEPVELRIELEGKQAAT